MNNNYVYKDRNKESSMISEHDAKISLLCYFLKNCKSILWFTLRRRENQLKTYFGPANITSVFYAKKKLDVDPQRDDDASPMSTYRCMLRPT